MSVSSCIARSKSTDSKKYKVKGDDSKTLSGTMQACFVNRYSPQHDKPFEALQLTSDRYLDEELCDLLQEDRQIAAKYHRTSDKKFKEFLFQKWQDDMIQKEFDKQLEEAKPKP